MKYKVWTCHAQMISPSIFSHFPIDSAKVHQFNLQCTTINYKRYMYIVWVDNRLLNA